MKNTMKLFYISLFLCLFSACKDETVDSPKDTPPVVQSFSVVPSSVEAGQNVKFAFSVTDAEGLDSLVLKYGDGGGRSFIAGRKKAMVDSVEHSYSSPGTKTATLTAYADGKTDAKSVIVGVNQDIPPVVQSFSVVPSSVEVGQNAKFVFSVSDAEGLDSLVLKYGDGSGRSFIVGRNKAVVDSVEHSYSSSGAKVAVLTAYADGKTDAKSVIVGVNQDIPPIIDAVSLAGVEGQSGSLSLASFAHDPEGKPVSISVKAGNPSVNVSVSDSVRYSGVNADVNGSFPVTFSVSDGVNVTDKIVPIVLAARDDIRGRAHDAMEGTLPASLKPELVMNAPFDLSKSYLKIDGHSISMDANGNFTSPKLAPGAHALEVALVNMGNDSSFIATYQLPAGDRTFDPHVNTNAGTGRSLITLWNFYYIVNFRYNGIPELKLNGIDFSHANDYTGWISRKDTVINE
jgi:hypothetical protein